MTYVLTNAITGTTIQASKGLGRLAQQRAYLVANKMGPAYITHADGSALSEVEAGIFQANLKIALRGMKRVAA